MSRDTPDSRRLREESMRARIAVPIRSSAAGSDPVRDGRLAGRATTETAARRLERPAERGFRGRAPD